MCDWNPFILGNILLKNLIYSVTNHVCIEKQENPHLNGVTWYPHAYQNTSSENGTLEVRRLCAKQSANQTI